MSAEPTPPLEPEWVPNPHESEVERNRREDPDFPNVVARCFAKARGETYSPKRHGPFEPGPVRLEA